MQPAGHKLIARWREAGEWWSGEPYREIRRTLDERGIRHEEERSFETLGETGVNPPLRSSEADTTEDNKEEWTLKRQKRRDEKVRKLSEAEGRGDGLALGLGPQALGEGRADGLALGLGPQALGKGGKAEGKGDSNAGITERKIKCSSIPNAQGPEPKAVPLPNTPPSPNAQCPKPKAVPLPNTPPSPNAQGPMPKAVPLPNTTPSPNAQGPMPKAVPLPNTPPSPNAQGPKPKAVPLPNTPPAPNAQCPRPKAILSPNTQHPTPNTPPSPLPTTHYPLPTPNAPYAPLHIYSGYAFGRGSMLAEEIPILCAHAGAPAAAIADPFSLVGAVEFSKQANKSGVMPLIGVSVEMEEGGYLVLIAKNKAGYQNLSKLVTACHLEEARQFPLCNWQRLQRFSKDLICLTGGDLGPLNPLLIRREYKAAKALVERLIQHFGRENVFIEIERSFLPWEIPVNELLIQLAENLKVLPVAGGVATHARRGHFPVQDTLVCADTLCTVDEIIGRKPPRHPSQPHGRNRPERALNAERFLHTCEEMERLFRDRPELLANTLKVAERCDKDVLPPRTQLPKLYADEAYVLREYTYAGALLRHKKLSPKLKRRLDHELDRISRLNFAGHFLVMWDACRWASDQNILFTGRGSVVDSAVAYCLGLSKIDAFAHNLHFDRFLPQDGSKRPDIDIDFEARRRNDIRNYLTRKYGQDHVATVAAVGAYCTRGIVREVGKVLGLPNELIGFLAKRIHGGVSPAHLEEALQQRPELRGSSVPKERFQWVFRLAERLMDIPRNIRAHSSGVVISSRPLAETVPVMWSASEGVESFGETEDFLRIIQWDKRSAKHYFDKFDVLCLRGQDVLAGTQQRVRLNDIDFRVQDLPSDDEHTYSAMRSGELIGIPQSASPAMRQAHIRLKTENLHDASLVQAGIRPGVGGSVKLNSLIRRRRGLETYSFSHPDLEKILGLTYGIIVFQEQVDQLLQTFCGFSSGEAEDTREAIHKRRREDYGKAIHEQLIERMMSLGHPEPLAEEVFDLIAGFKGYGFAQGHALAFAEISIRSIYCQQNFPAEYFAAILSAQPAGYYGSCTLVNEARTRGVSILSPDVNLSELEFSVESIQSEMDPKLIFPSGAIRVGLNQVLGVSRETNERIVGEGRDGLALGLGPWALGEGRGERVEGRGEGALGLEPWAFGEGRGERVEGRGEGALGLGPWALGEGRGERVEGVGEGALGLGPWGWKRLHSLPSTLYPPLTSNTQHPTPFRLPMLNAQGLRPIRPPTPNTQHPTPLRPPMPKAQCPRPFRSPTPNTQHPTPHRPPRLNAQGLRPIRPPTPNT